MASATPRLFLRRSPPVKPARSSVCIGAEERTGAERAMEILIAINQLPLLRIFCYREGTIKLTSAKCVSDLLCISNVVVSHQRGAALVCVLPYCPTRNQRTVASSLREYLVPRSLFMDYKWLALNFHRNEPAPFCISSVLSTICTIYT